MLVCHSNATATVTLVLCGMLMVAIDLALALDRYRFRNGVMLGIGLCAAGCYRALGCQSTGSWQRVEVTAVALAAVVLAQFMRQLVQA